MVLCSFIHFSLLKSYLSACLDHISFLLFSITKPTPRKESTCQTLTKGQYTNYPNTCNHFNHNLTLLVLHLVQVIKPREVKCNSILLEPREIKYISILEELSKINNMNNFDKRRVITHSCWYVSMLKFYIPYLSKLMVIMAMNLVLSNNSRITHSKFPCFFSELIL